MLSLLINILTQLLSSKYFPCQENLSLSRSAEETELQNEFKDILQVDLFTLWRDDRIEGKGTSYSQARRKRYVLFPA